MGDAGITGAIGRLIFELKGPQIEGVYIMEFPSVDAAKEWYDSPAYREAREHRFKGAEYRAVIVQGCKGRQLQTILSQSGPVALN